MNTKIEKLSLLIISFVILFSANLAFANPIPLESSFSASQYINYASVISIVVALSIIILGLGSEIFFGYLFFFRDNKKGFFSLVYANLLSYPIFYFFTAGTHLISISVGEVMVVVIEAIFIKWYLKEEVSFKKVLFISILTNVLSIVVSIFLSGFFYIFIESFNQPNF